MTSRIVSSLYVMSLCSWSKKHRLKKKSHVNAKDTQLKKKKAEDKESYLEENCTQEQNQASHSAYYTKRAAYKVSQPHAGCDLRAVWPKLLSSASRKSTWAQRQVGWHTLHYWWQISGPGGRVRSKALAEVAGKKTGSQPSLRVSEIFSVNERAELSGTRAQTWDTETLPGEEGHRLKNCKSIPLSEMTN